MCVSEDQIKFQGLEYLLLWRSCTLGPSSRLLALKGTASPKEEELSRDSRRPVFFSFFKKKNFIEIQLTYNVLVSGVQQSDLHIYSSITFPSIIGYYRIVSIFPCAI